LILNHKWSKWRGELKKEYDKGPLGEFSKKHAIEPKIVHSIEALSKKHGPPRILAKT
jgi:hypothetical protein